MTQDLDLQGKVFVHGEIWNAVSASGRLGRGSRVRVAKVENMKLAMKPAEDRPGRGR